MYSYSWLRPDYNDFLNAQAAGTLKQVIGLTNNIHPLLSRDNFSPDIDYDAIAPILRLVSRLLRTPPVRHYLYTTWWGSNELVSGASSQEVYQRYSSDRSVTNLSQSDVEAVEEGLLALADMLTFEMVDFGADGKNVETGVNRPLMGSGRIDYGLPGARVSYVSTPRSTRQSACLRASKSTPATALTLP